MKFGEINVFCSAFFLLPFAAISPVLSRQQHFLRAADGSSSDGGADDFFVQRSSKKSIVFTWAR